MRAIISAIVAVLALNLLAIVALVGWLYASDRLDARRVNDVIDTFRLTLAEETSLAAEAAAAEAQAQEMRVQMARLEAVADGPKTTQDRLFDQQQRDEIAEARVQRLQRDIADLQRQLELAQSRIAKDRAQLIADRQAFEAALQRETELQTSESFQQAVRTYEQLKPRQVKQMFQSLMDEGHTAQVVDYLATMQTRKAAAVLKEFKEPQEIEQAAGLVEALRNRGIDLTGSEPAEAS